MVLKKLTLMSILNALCDQLQSQITPHTDDGFGDHLTATVGDHILDECSINLQSVYWQPMKVLKR